MSWLGGAALAVGAVLIAEGYVLICRGQRFLTYAEQIGAALGLRLADLPGKSAARTDGSSEQPRRWWQRLAALTVPENEPPAVPEARRPDDVDQALARFKFADGHTR